MPYLKISGFLLIFFNIATTTTTSFSQTCNIPFFLQKNLIHDDTVTYFSMLGQSACLFSRKADTPSTLSLLLKAE